MVNNNNNKEMLKQSFVQSKHIQQKALLTGDPGVHTFFTAHTHTHTISGNVFL